MAQITIEPTEDPVHASPFTHSTGEFFSTSHLNSDLKARSVRGGAATVATQAAKFLIKFSSVPIMARLLTPEDFGLVAMVTVVTGFVEMFKDAGLSTATIQKAEINHDQVSTLFWINVSISVVLMAILICLAPGIAWFYGEPRVTWIAVALAGTLLLGGLAIQHEALLRRQMRFGVLGIIEVASQAIGVIAAIVAAATGAGYWAIIIMTVASSLTSVAAMWLVCPWSPGTPKRRTGVRPMLAFGGHLTASSLFSYIQRSADNLLIGWAWGAGSLGIYAKAYQILLLPFTQVKGPVAAVAVPALCRLQNQPERYRRYYCRAIEIVVTLTSPIVVFCYVAANDLILTILGPQWDAVIPVFCAMAPAALMTSVAIGHGWVLISTGRTKKLANINFYTALCIVVSFAVGLHRGPIGVAYAYSIITCLVYPLGMVYALGGTPLRLREVLHAVKTPLFASFFAGASVLLCDLWLEAITPCPFALLRETVVFLVSFAAAFTLQPGGRRSLMEFSGLLSQFVKKARPFTGNRRLR